MLQDLTVVRKELKVTHPTHSDDFERECQVLSLLNCLDHPNIVELLGSYTYGGIHSLIFPVAEYNLGQLLQNPQTASFGLQSDYLFALCGLASALDKLHSFSSKVLDVSLIGCHHDIRPNNILVQEGRFMLADFGLTTLKKVTEGSKTIWKTGDSRYLAPECEDVDDGFQPREIGRRSDVWSFGCVLLELLTYIMQGPAGVKAFEQSRKVMLNSRWTVYSFHAGHQPNKGVEAWVTELDKNATTACKALIGLVRDMLQIEPDDRPDAHQVTQHLRFWTLESKFSDVDDILNNTALRSSDLNMIVEKERLLTWAQTMCIAGPASPRFDTESFLTADDIFRRTFRSLQKIESDATVNVKVKDDFHAKSTRLRMINDEIIDALPANLQLSINNSLEQRLVSTDDLGVLQKIRQTFDETSQYRSIGTLAAVKYMHELCGAPTDGHGRRMQLKEVTRRTKKSFDHFTIDELSAEGWPPALTLLEDIEYEEHWVDVLGNELFDRIGSVLELMRTASQSDKQMRLLSPIGWFHEPQIRRFKMVFSIPSSTEAGENNTPRIETLRQLIGAKEKYLPALEDRFLLARRLIAALSRLHKVKWVHKNISAFSIIFSLPPRYLVTQGIPPPYLIGFNHSRPDDLKSWSKTPKYSLEVTDYCHPEYLKQIKRVRYHPRFDWYSLGLVLLEIGIWRTLSGMTSKKQTLPPEELLEHILQRYVPQLDFYMGKRYRTVVEWCLQGQSGMKANDSIEPGGPLFAKMIQEQLASCSL